MDTAVDLDAQMAALQGQVRDAGEGRQIGAGLQGGELVRDVGAVGGQEQAKVHALQRETQLRGAAPVGAQEGVDAAAAHRQRVGMDDFTVRQREVLLLALEGEAALQLKEVENIHVQRGGCAQQGTTGAVHVERERAAGAGGHVHAVGRPVEHFAAGGHGVGLVDLQLDVLRAGGQAVHTSETGRGDAGLHRNPLARGVALVGRHHRAKAGTGKAQADGLGGAAVHANEARGVAGTNFEQVGGGGTGVALHPHRALALFKRHIAMKLGKAQEVDVQRARGTGQHAQRARHIDVGGRASASGHREGVGACKVKHGCVAGRAVDEHGQAAACHREAVDAHHRHLPCRGFEAGPLTRCRHPMFAGQHQGKAGVAERQTCGVGGACVDARKGLQASAADGQQIGGHRGCRAANPCVQAGGFACDGQVALGLEEAKGAQVQVATGAQQVAVGASHAEGLLTGGAGGDHQVLCVVVDQLAVGGGLVDFDQQVAASGLQAVHAGERDAGGRGLEAGPFASGARGDVFAGQDQGQVDARHVQAHGLGGAAVDAGKSLDAVGPQGEFIDRDAVAVAEFEGVGLFAQRKVTVELNKTKDIHIEVGAGLQQRTTAAVHAQGKAGAHARGHRQRGFAGAVVNDFVV